MGMQCQDRIQNKVRNGLSPAPRRTVDVACGAVEAEHAGAAVEGRHKDLRMLRRRRLCGHTQQPRCHAGVHTARARASNGRSCTVRSGTPISDRY